MSNKLFYSTKDIFSRPLDRLNAGDCCEIVSVDDDTCQNRLAELGLTAGASVKVIRTAPLGDPIEIALRGYRLCLRRQTASRILVKITE